MRNKSNTRCGHCKSLAPEYQKAAKALKGIIGVGAVDCDQHKSLCGQYGVQVGGYRGYRLYLIL